MQIIKPESCILDEKSPFAQGLLLCFPFNQNSPTQTQFDLVNGFQATPHNSPAPITTSKGNGYALLRSSSKYWNVAYNALFHPTKSMTVMCVVSGQFDALSQKQNFAGYAQSGSGFIMDLNDGAPSDNLIYFFFHYGGAYHNITYATGNLPTSKVDHVLIESFDGRFMYASVDGKIAGSIDNGSTTTIDQPTHNDLAIGDNMGVGSTPEGNYWNGNYSMFAMWNRGLTINEHQKLGLNPFAMFKQSKSGLFLPR